jgi:tetratricopeptide (TPR) repeat protein
MEREAEKEWMQRVIRALDASCPDVQDVTQWDACEQWLPHAQLCAIWIEQEGITLLEAARMLNQAGYYLYDHARYAEAEPLHMRAFAIREEQLGARHPNTARSLTNLAALYRAQGKYAEAVLLSTRALEIYEEQLGRTDPDTATSLNNLALLYQTQGKYTEAEQVRSVCASVTR